MEEEEERREELARTVQKAEEKKQLGPGPSYFTLKQIAVSKTAQTKFNREQAKLDQKRDALPDDCDLESNEDMDVDEYEC